MVLRKRQGARWKWRFLAQQGWWSRQAAGWHEWETDAHTGGSPQQLRVVLQTTPAAVGGVRQAPFRPSEARMEDAGVLSVQTMIVASTVEVMGWLGMAIQVILWTRVGVAGAPEMTLASDRPVAMPS